MGDFKVRYVGGLEAVERPGGGEPLRNGDEATVDEDTAARLVAQGDWEAVDGAEPQRDEQAVQAEQESTVQAEQPAKSGG